MTTQALAETSVMMEDLEMFYTTFQAVHNYLEAQDMAKCQLNMLPTYRTSPLTQDVAVSLKRVEGLMGDFLLSQHLHQEDEEEEDVEEEQQEELPDAPFGEPDVKKAPKRVSEDAERVRLESDDEDSE